MAVPRLFKCVNARCPCSPSGICAPVVGSYHFAKKEVWSWIVIPLQLSTLDKRSPRFCKPEPIVDRDTFTPKAQEFRSKICAHRLGTGFS